MKIKKITAAFMAAAMAFGSSGAVNAVVTPGEIQTVLKSSDVSPVKKAHAEEKTSATMKAGGEVFKNISSDATAIGIRYGN